MTARKFDREGRLSRFSLDRKVTVLVLLTLPSRAVADESGDLLKQGFLAPPDSAKPRVWWHWMNGNITKEGIEADLRWMKRVGIGGMQNFDGALDTPQVVDKRLVYMTPEWKDAFRFAVSPLPQAARLD